MSLTDKLKNSGKKVLQFEAGIDLFKDSVKIIKSKDEKYNKDIFLRPSSLFQNAIELVIRGEITLIEAALLVYAYQKNDTESTAYALAGIALSEAGKVGARYIFKGARWVSEKIGPTTNKLFKRDYLP